MKYFQTFLKIGSAAIVIACLSQGLLKELDFELLDPVKSFQSVSVNPMTALNMKDGNTISAIEMQNKLLMEIEKESKNIIMLKYLETDYILEIWKEKLEELTDWLPKAFKA